MSSKSKSRSSLASSLALLNDSAPVEFDPEHDEQSVHSEADPSETEDHDPTSHYLTDLPTSQLRRKSKISESDTLDQPRYKGVNTSVKEMFGNGIGNDDQEEEEDEWDDEPSLDVDDDQDEDEDEDQSDLQDDDEEEEEEEEEEVSEDLESQGIMSKPTSTSSKTKKKLRFAQEELGPSNPSSSLQPTTSLTDSSTLDSQSQSDANLIKSLREKNKADAKKAREIQLQIKGWEKSLEGRIRLQGLVRNLNRVELLRKGKNKEEVGRLLNSESLLSTLSSLSSTLFQLRTSHLITNHPSTEEPLSDLRSSSSQVDSILNSCEKSEKSRRNKRKRDSNDEGSAEDQENDETLNSDERHLKEIQSLLEIESNLYHPLQINLLNKWSSKVSNASSSSNSSSNFSSSNNLKSINQSSGKQVELTLSSGDGLSRLISRTKNLRDVSIIGSSSSNNDSSKNVDGNTATASNEEDDFGLNEEIFDDSDFYNSLLKELIESKGSMNGAGANGKKVGGVEIDGKGLDVLDSDSLNFGKKKKIVDTKGSKGRRLRYEPITPLQAFMPPIPRQLWSTEQTEQLFRQIKLAHGSTASEAGDGEEMTGLEAELNGTSGRKVADEKMEDRVDLAGLRVFG